MNGAATGKSVVDTGYERLKGMIQQGELEAGQRITEREMSQLLGISRNSVRKVLARLENDNLVVGGRCMSKQVTEWYDDDNFEAFIYRLELRGALLGQAGFNAAQHMDPWQAERLRRLSTKGDAEAFFEYLLSNSGNPILMKVWKQEALHPTLIRDEEKIRQFDEAIAEMGMDHLDHIDGACFTPAFAKAVADRDGDRARKIMSDYHAATVAAYRQVHWQPDEEQGSVVESDTVDGTADSAVLKLTEVEQR